MISYEEDRQALLDAYRKYAGCCKHKEPNMTKLFEIRTDLYGSADCIIRDLANDKLPQTMKNKSVIQSKTIYGRFCRFKRHYGIFTTAQLDDKMEALIEAVSFQEAKTIQQIRHSVQWSGTISLLRFFSTTKRVRSVCSLELHRMIRDFFIQTSSDPSTPKNKRVDEDGCYRTDRSVFVTHTGKHYHRSDCPYCRGNTMLESSYYLAAKNGYSPCSCIKQLEKLTYRTVLSIQEQKLIKDAVVTAFVDESYRNTPWLKFDDTQNPNQMSYSYIVCKGWLNHEREITQEKTVFTGTGLADDNARHMEEGTSYAIMHVLMRLAFEKNFHGSVIIYTDNSAAVTRWENSPINKGLSKQFDSIRVSLIKRDENKAADAIGRKRVFLNIRKEALTEINSMLVQGKRDHNALGHIQKYFEDPDNDIPILISEIKDLAYMTDLKKEQIDATPLLSLVHMIKERTWEKNGAL